MGALGADVELADDVLKELEDVILIEVRITGGSGSEGRYGCRSVHKQHDVSLQDTTLVWERKKVYCGLILDIDGHLWQAVVAREIVVKFFL